MDRLPTDDQIRGMDGPALTRLAYELGLAPTQPRRYFWEDKWLAQGLDRPCFYGYHEDGERFINRFDPWCPDTNVQQAREVFFDRLATHNLVTNHYAGNGWGRAYAKQSARSDFKRERPYIVEILWGLGEAGIPPEDSEALALLRCACCAVAAQQREVTHI